MIQLFAFLPNNGDTAIVVSSSTRHFNTKSTVDSTEDANCTWPEKWAEWYPHPQSGTRISSQQGTEEKCEVYIYSVFFCFVKYDV